MAKKKLTKDNRAIDGTILVRLHVLYFIKK